MVAQISLSFHAVSLDYIVYIDRFLRSEQDWKGFVIWHDTLP